MALSSLQVAIDGLESALASDSANPQASYSLNGKSVQRSEWREAMMRTLAEMKKQVNQYQPYVIRTRKMV